MIVKISGPVVIGRIATLVVAVMLVFTNTAKPVAAAEGGLNFKFYPDRATPARPTLTTPMRDGCDLVYRRFDGPVTAPLVLPVHGSDWHGLQSVSLADKLSADAAVIAPDLREHGLSILHSFGIRAPTDRTVIQFARTALVLDGLRSDTATAEDRFRLNAGFAPRSDYLSDAGKLPRFAPVGDTQDEAIHAALYEPALAPATDKESYFLIPGRNHLASIHAAEKVEIIADFLHGI